MLPLHHAPKAVAHASFVIIALPVGDVNPDYSMVYYTYRIQPGPREDGGEVSPRIGCRTFPGARVLREEFDNSLGWIFYQ